MDPEWPSDRKDCIENWMVRMFFVTSPHEKAIRQPLRKHRTDGLPGPELLIPSPLNYINGIIMSMEHKAYLKIIK